MKTYTPLALLAVTALSACTLGANGEKDCEKRIPDIISEYSGKAESGFSIFYSQKKDICVVNYTAPAEKEWSVGKSYIIDSATKAVIFETEDKEAWKAKMREIK